MDDYTKMKEAKKLLQEYGEALIKLKAENEKIKQDIIELKKEYKKIPKVIRNIFIKSEICKQLIDN